VRSFGGLEARINERISGGKEVNCGKDMIDFGIPVAFFWMVQDYA